MVKRLPAYDKRAYPSATWEELKQFLVGLALVVPFIAVFAYGARVLLGPEMAFWLGVGIVGAAVVCYGSVVVACLVVSYAVDFARYLAKKRGDAAQPPSILTIVVG
jgi:cation transporter-like permease